MLTRRHVLASALAAPAILRFSSAQAATTLKISHQFPGGTIDKGDFRDRLTRKFAAEVQQTQRRRHRRRDLPWLVPDQDQRSVFGHAQGRARYEPLSLPYAGGELPETNIALMPGLVPTYDVGLGWKTKPVGKALTDFLADKGIMDDLVGLAEQAASPAALARWSPKTPRA